MKKTNKFLVILTYCERPRMVNFALSSLKHQFYDNWRLAIIDDAPDPDLYVWNRAKELLPKKEEEIFYYPSGQSKKAKRAFGSNWGLLINEAVLEHSRDCDLVLFLSDDDLLTRMSMVYWNLFFSSISEEWDRGLAMHHPFDITRDEEMRWEDPETWPWVAQPDEIMHNANGAWYGGDGIDLCQTCYRPRLLLSYPFPGGQTRGIDKTIHDRIIRDRGPFPWLNFFTAYKNMWAGALTNNKDDDTAKDIDNER